MLIKNETRSADEGGYIPQQRLESSLPKATLFFGADFFTLDCTTIFDDVDILNQVLTCCVIVVRSRVGVVKSIE